jgi:cell division protein FtsN
MDENTKLFIFDKKEIAVLFIFMLLLTTISFMLGIRVGKEFSFKKNNIQSEDVRLVDLKSSKEESIERRYKDIESKSLEQTSGNQEVDLMDYSINRAKLEVKDAAKGGFKKRPKIKKESKIIKPKILNPQSLNEKVIQKEIPQKKKLDLSYYAKEESPKSNNSSVKKIIYTIQVGSYPQIEKAKTFSDGFIARGYPTNIFKADLGKKGIYFRVSIGSFKSKVEASEYIVNERSLFRGTNYLIRKLDLNVTNFIK